MPKFRKKPVVIEAMVWDGNDHRGMYEFLGGDDKDFMSPSGENFYIDHSKVAGGLMLKTLEGEHKASIGDYVIKGISGEYYPCKPDIFSKTYDNVE
ncbi:MAG: hypothetical protein JKY81_04770 [Colwellia sp.]|nr:hypothetical protein [Colwellia sp.]